MKDIEDAFHAVAEQIVSGRSSLLPEQHPIVTKFFALWVWRARLQHDPIADQAIAGVAGEPLTKDHQEGLEVEGRVYVRSDQTMPGRFLAGVQGLQEIDAVSAEFEGRRWGVVRAAEGEFICPDTFGQLAAVPVTPTICLCRDHQDSVIPKCEVGRANRSAQQSARRYCIARDFAACPV